ncbi:spore cortex biosynthesis protein YabQ [Microaerobacter geothermalis]|uniref:spore cortex biosynthesis protein YabQ n=1 Tax=Microaerobacter geothermalis TaxID=674972 RepID=UPI001F37826D|nr:spore cortex biosynthesis protein YabQ [Microaerobacter geothermalis]MCF6094690.1 spore cortex biosynthesis protein YabQ [Microaerobacter geothermalis]
MSIIVQFHTFLWTVVNGIALGLLFDIYRVFRIFLRLSKFFLFLTDLLYWFFAIPLVFFTLLFVNDGEVRIYIFLGLFLGGILYFYFMSSLMMRFLIGLVRWLIQLYESVKKMIHFIVIKPLIFLFRFLLRSVQIIFISALTIVWWIILKLYHLLTWMFLWLMRPFNRVWGNKNKEQNRSYNKKGFFQRIKKLFSKKK